jgi:hypothetical protein
MNTTLSLSRFFSRITNCVDGAPEQIAAPAFLIRSNILTMGTGIETSTQVLVLTAGSRLQDDIPTMTIKQVLAHLDGVFPMDEAVIDGKDSHGIALDLSSCFL